jgi:hypothetical protein
VVSFFNELEIKKPCSKTFVSFFNEVASEMQKTIIGTSVSFFNKIAAETQKLSSKVSLLDHGFQEDNAPE